MNRIGAILMTVAVVGALLAVPLDVSAAAADHNGTTSGANSSVAPGERLAGAVGVQEATVEGDLSERTYEVRLRTAESDEQRADIVAERRDEIEQRLKKHKTDLAELRTARKNGTISEGAYRARVATVAAEKSSTERSATRAGATARELPEAILDEREISVAALEELRKNASELGGPETAAIAREIGGRNRGSEAAHDRPRETPNGGPSRDGTTGEDRPGEGVGPGGDTRGPSDNRPNPPEQDTDGKQNRANEDTGPNADDRRPNR